MQQTDIVLSTISAHPHNPRRDVGDVTDLAESIRQVGLLEPLVVAPWPDDLDRRMPPCPSCGSRQSRCTTPAGKPAKAWHTERQALADAATTHLLLAGHRRLAACRAAGMDSAPAVIRDDLTTLAAQVEVMLTENLHRVDLTPIEEARAYQGLLDLRITQTRVSQITAQPKTRIRDRLKLLRLSDRAQESVHTGQITLGQALAMTSFVDQPEWQELEKTIGKAGWEYALERAERSRRSRVELERRVAAYRDAGYDVVDEEPAGARRLEGMLPGGHYFSTAADMDAWVHEHHDTCSGRVMVLTGRSWDPLVPWCLRPDLHAGDAPAGDTASEPSKDELEQRAAEAQLEADRDAATAVRIRHLQAVLKAPSDGVAEMALQELLLDWIDERGSRPAKVMFGQLYPGREAADVTARMGLVQLAALAVVLVQGASPERYIQSFHDRRLPSHSSYAEERRWLHDLAGLWGYTLTPFEQELLAGETAASEAAPADAGDDADEDVPA